MNSTKKFRMQTLKGEQVMGGDLSDDNVYIRTYGKVVLGRQPNELDIGETCQKEYALCGQGPTTYEVIRTA